MINSDIDKLIWNKDPSGVVTTKSFMKSFLPPVIPRREFEIIWQSWLPPKVSCFLWRIMHKALSTNDNIIRAGIALASRCLCCDLPQCESMDHLFIHSDMAGTLWETLCPVFRRQRPGSLKVFFLDWGVRADFKRYSNLFAFGLSCLCLWEVWKIRNANVYDGGNSRLSKANIARCASVLANIVPAKCYHDPLSRRVCSVFGISPPLIQEFKVYWSPWRPHAHGNTCNIAIHLHDNRSKAAAIIRNPFGELVYAFKFTTTGKHFIKCMFQLFNEIHGVFFNCVQASQEDIFLLGRNSDVDWGLFQIKRKLVKALSHAVIFKVSFSLNKPAEALCYSRIDYLRCSRMPDLPPEVQKAISSDGLLHPCSSRDQQIFI